MNILLFFEQLLGSYAFLITVATISFTLKTIILTLVLAQQPSSPSIRKAYFYLLMVLLGAMISDFSWIVKLISLLFIPTMDYRIVIFWIRIAWAATVVIYQSLALFTQSLINDHHKQSPAQKIYFVINA